MNTVTQPNTQPVQENPIPMKGVRNAKKEPPKIIEKMIDKVEKFLTSPAKPTSTQEAPSDDNNEEVTLPKGTTITLPNGKSFETQIESRLSRA